MTDDPLAAIVAAGAVGLPGLLGVEVDRFDPEEPSLRLRMAVREDLFAPNGYLHGGSLVALADTACGYACQLSLPDGATGFTTVELKANFIGAARSGEILCEATRLHGGRTTQVWDAVVSAGERTLAAVRCTQLILR